MLYKPLVSLVMVFVATSSVAASATPIRRGLVPGYGPALPGISTSQCDPKDVQCCDGSGMNCNALSGTKCEQTAFCCSPNAQGTVVIQCIPINISL